MLQGINHNGKEVALSNEDFKAFQVDAFDERKKQVTFRINGVKYLCKILSYDKVKELYTIKINGHKTIIKKTSPLQNIIDKIGINPLNDANVNDLKSPMPGLILQINGTAGDVVKKDQPLIILEAMKMENVLTSPIDGVIKEINVQPQQTVEKNSLLIVFES